MCQACSFLHLVQCDSWFLSTDPFYWNVFLWCCNYNCNLWNDLLKGCGDLDLTRRSCLFFQSWLHCLESFLSSNPPTYPVLPVTVLPDSVETACQIPKRLQEKKQKKKQTCTLWEKCDSFNFRAHLNVSGSWEQCSFMFMFVS